MNHATRIALVVLSLTAIGAIAVLASSDASDSAVKDGPGRAIAVADPIVAAPITGSPERETRPERDTKLALDTPRGARPLVWVRKGRSVALRTRPGGGRLVERVGKRTPFGSPTVFAVARTSGNWAAVSTPELPNGTLGWIELDSRNLDAGWTKVAIVVDLSDRRASLIEDDRVVRSFTVTIGMPGSETPTGAFAVTDTFRGGLDASYGCCALALSATQPNVPSGWLGGRRIAIHGTDGPLGVAASHGCVRATDRDVRAMLRRVPLGTPVVIRT